MCFKYLWICEVILLRLYSLYFGMSLEDQCFFIDGDGDYCISWVIVDDGCLLVVVVVNFVFI